MNTVGNVNCELLRHLLASAWEDNDAQRVKILSQAVDGLTVRCLQGEQAKTI